LTKIPDQQMRQSAFKDFMQKNMPAAEQRKAYASAMTAYYKANNPNPAKVNPIQHTQPGAQGAGAHVTGAPVAGAHLPPGVTLTTKPAQ
jgi:hypothetical protein